MRQDKIAYYFPDFTKETIEKLISLEEHYIEWNAKINVISRKDMDAFFEHHLLHSLALVPFLKNQLPKIVVDIGTGGGFPGVPLALVFPDIEFHVVDSIGKKLKNMAVLKEEKFIDNITLFHQRVEQLPYKYDLAVSRAVAPMVDLWRWMKGKWNNKTTFYLLKGGELREEYLLCKTAFPKARMKEFDIREQFNEPYFDTKKVIHLHENGF